MNWKKEENIQTNEQKVNRKNKKYRDYKKYILKYIPNECVHLGNQKKMREAWGEKNNWRDNDQEFSKLKLYI